MQGPHGRERLKGRDPSTRVPTLPDGKPLHGLFHLGEEGRCLLSFLVGVHVHQVRGTFQQGRSVDVFASIQEHRRRACLVVRPQDPLAMLLDELRSPARRHGLRFELRHAAPQFRCTCRISETSYKVKWLSPWRQSLHGSVPQQESTEGECLSKEVATVVGGGFSFPEDTFLLTRLALLGPRTIKQGGVHGP